MRALSDRGGFTLIELLVAMTIGMVIVGATLTLLTVAEHSRKDTADRVDAVQRGRTALEAMTQELRSMTCAPGVSNAYPIVSADADQVTFYAGLNDATAAGWDDPARMASSVEQRRLVAIRANGALTGIREDRWAGVSVPVAPSVAPTRQRMLATSVTDLPGAPLFAYYAYPSATAEQPTQVLTGLPLASPATSTIVRIDLNFLAQPTDPSSTTRTSVPMQAAVYARTIKRDNATTAIPTFDCS
jgi:prepilin-type N-terminal cleavage/methylation domain-containing protein